MNLNEIEGDFSISKLDEAAMPEFPGKFVSYTRTENELSLVCETLYAPSNCLKQDSG